jgi:hypothetical protein
MGRAGRPTALHTRLKDEQPQEADARVGTWPREQLERMDARFVALSARSKAAARESLRQRRLSMPPAGCD